MLETRYNPRGKRSYAIYAEILMTIYMTRRPDDNLVGAGNGGGTGGQGYGMCWINMGHTRTADSVELEKSNK